MQESSAARRATLRRSARLWRAFRLEQTQPDLFYRLLASDTVELVGAFAQLAGSTVLDVGAGPGYFAESFEAAGARYAAVDPDLGELSAAGSPGANTLRASGLALPVASQAVDVVVSSNVAEHVRWPGLMAQEMIRVVRPGGTAVLSFTLWWGPWGGHETAPWHYLGGNRAARRYERKNGHPPKNRYGESLFPTHAGQALHWARTRPNVDVVAAFPRYLPHWSWWVVGVPVLREVVVWNLVLVLRRRHAEGEVLP